IRCLVEVAPVKAEQALGTHGTIRGIGCLARHRRMPGRPVPSVLSPRPQQSVRSAVAAKLLAVRRFLLRAERFRHRRQLSAAIAGGLRRGATYLAAARADLSAAL